MGKTNRADTEAERCFEIQKRCSGRSRAADAVTLCLFGALVITVALFVWFAPQKSFSENENRYLATREKINFSLGAEDFTGVIADMYADQFPLRSELIEAKARIETTLGKRENNGVMIAGNDLLIKKAEYSAAEKKTVFDNAFAIKEFSKAFRAEGASVSFAVAPRATDLFDGPILYSRERADSTWEILKSVGYLDLRAALRGEGYLHFKTDHHWTALGAYHAYLALAESLEYEPIPLADFTERTVSENFCGTVWSKSGAYWTKPDRISVFEHRDDDKITVYDCQSEKKLEFGLYDESKLKIKDKYAVFLGGDHGHIKISDGAEKPRLLVIKDSYFNSLAPFLCRHFELDVIDLRYFSGSAAEYAREQGIDRILILCGLDSLASAPTFTALRYKISDHR